MSVYVSVQSRGVIAIPPTIRRAYHLDEPGSQVEIFEEPGRIVLIPKIAVDASQAWFWTPQWQAMEAEASREHNDGSGTMYDNSDDFVDDLP